MFNEFFWDCLFYLQHSHVHVNRKLLQVVQDCQILIVHVKTIEPIKNDRE